MDILFCQTAAIQKTSEQNSDHESEWELFDNDYPIIWYDPSIDLEEKKSLKALLQENSSINLFSKFRGAFKFAKALGTSFLLIAPNEVHEKKLLKRLGVLTNTSGRKYSDFEEEAVLASLFKEIPNEIKTAKVCVFFSEQDFLNEAPVNEEEEEVTVMCDINEMAKQFREEFTIFWYDPNFSPENKEIFVKEFEILEENIYNNFEDLLKKLENYNELPYHLVFSGETKMQRIDQVKDFKDLLGLYIYDSPLLVVNGQMNRNIKIEKTLDGLIPKIREGIRTNSQLKNTLPAFVTQFDTWDKSHINKIHEYLKGFVNFNNRRQAKEDFINLAKKIYQSKKLFEFESEYDEYNKDKILKWYAAESPVYKLINNCLRISTSDSIWYGRFLLKDMERAIREECLQENKRYTGVVYRGAYISKEEFEKLEINLGKEIEMSGFLSTSASLEAAKNFLFSDIANKVLITVIIPPLPIQEFDEQGFVSLSKFSKFTKEEEILFNVRSKFQVLKVGRIKLEKKNKETECRHLVLLYGAQLLRKYMTIKKPTISLKLELPVQFKCNFCESKYNLFVSKTETGASQMICQECLICIDDSIQKDTLLLPIHETVGLEKEEKMINIEVKGEILEFGIEAKLVYERSQYCHKCLQSGKDLYKKWINLENENMTIECLDCFSQSRERKFGHALFSERAASVFWTKKLEKWEKVELELKTRELKSFQNFDVADIFLNVQDYRKCQEFCRISLQKLVRKMRRENWKIILYGHLGESSDSMGDHQKALEYNLRIQNIQTSINKKTHPYFSPCFSNSYNNLGVSYESLGEYKKALKYHLKGLKIAKSIDGEISPMTAISYNNLASLYGNLGDYQKAVEYHLSSLAIRKSIYGEIHPGTAPSYNNLASAYYSLGESQKAFEYLLRALDITTSIFGETHPKTATSYNNLALLYDSLGDYQKALEYQRKALDIRKSIFGETNLDTGESYCNLALLYSRLGEHKKALKYHLKALDIRKSFCGETHPKIAASYNNLASLYDSLGDYQKALEYQLKALDIRKSVYGEVHSETATSFANLALLYDSLGESQKALEYQLKALDITKSIFREIHPQTATSYNNLALVYDSLGVHKKALKYHLKSLDIRKALNGEKHPETATSYNNLASTYYSLGESQKALEYQLKALDIRKSIYGEIHTEVANSYNNLAIMYKSLGEHKNAFKYQLKALDIIKSIYGETHPHAATSFYNLASLYQHLEEYKKALEYHIKALNIRKFIYGETHSETAASYTNLALVFFSLGEDDKALGCFQKVLEIRKSLNKEIPFLIAEPNVLIENGIILPEELANFENTLLNVYTGQLSGKNGSKFVPEAKIRESHNYPVLQALIEGEKLLDMKNVKGLESRNLLVNCLCLINPISSIAVLSQLEPTIGLDQMLIISPTLFNSYVESLLVEFQNNGWNAQDLFIFADDHLILCQSKNEVARAIDVMKTWCREENIQLDPSKFEILELKLKRSTHSSQVNQEIENSPIIREYKFLGLEIYSSYPKQTN